MEAMWEMTSSLPGRRVWLACTLEPTSELSNSPGASGLGRETFWGRNMHGS